MTPRTRRISLLSLAAVAGVTLSACASAGDLDGGDSGDDAIVVGSQDYYSNEIIAEIYAQALEQGGYTVERDLRIGQREVYVEEIEDGSIDLFPEYTGPLLQYWVPDTTARLEDDVFAALTEAAPDGLRVLEQSAATDQDAYVVTREFADRYGLTTIDDLAKVTEPLTLGGNSEGEDRPNGPKGLAAAYGVDVSFTPIEDGGGPLTVKALQDGDIQLAIIYTADPSIEKNDLVALEDTKGLFLASHVVPIASDAIDEGAEEIIDAVSAALTPEGLVALNTESVDDEAPAASIAERWLEDNPLP
ncbi:ABC transporter substrate-binding protein [Labedella phragmitis]|uniref:ABC transporter substrate-binding protein n=1 Tax=Labedella phragmitis TaxID=2498849 RepID=A0A444PSH8_9MICO|nr:ABC transporter substrate-binding protein [Labedella phragmitis]RWZ50816.1 ABC transporter substrate-binding protein [Labedella phragmitis]